MTNKKLIHLFFFNLNRFHLLIVDKSMNIPKKEERIAINSQHQYRTEKRMNTGF